MRTTVVPVHHVPLNMVKSFLLIGERVVIVDSGMRGGAERIRDALQRAGRSPADVSLILITHSHADHCSDAAPRFWRRCGGFCNCPVCARFMCVTADRYSPRRSAAGSPRWKSRARHRKRRPPG